MDKNMTNVGYHIFSNFKKYLIYLSHVGYEFRGMQKQPPSINHGKVIIVDTVQETLEKALQFSLKTEHDVKVHTSSRTDAGVHALRTSVHVNLATKRELDPDRITCEVNKHFLANDVGIRIQSTQAVPDWFSSVYHATSRTYTYRFALRRTSKPLSKGLTEIPFSEQKRTFFIQNTDMDIRLMQKAVSLISGTRDYMSFMGRPRKAPKTSTIKSIYSMTLTPSRPFMPEYDLNSQYYDFWHLTCTGRSFLYRQIRRIMGVVLAVGQGQMDLMGVERLLDEPTPESWDPRAVCVPPWGLYLVDVTYNPLDLSPPTHQSFHEHHTQELTATYAL